MDVAIISSLNLQIRGVCRVHFNNDGAVALTQGADTEEERRGSELVVS